MTINRNLPNTLLIGPGRTGTTSLFRYLIQHPEICGSKHKEADRYRNLIFNKNLPAISEYEKQFDHCGGHKIIIEATPGYFFGGKTIAKRARKELGKLKIIIILRDPFDRALSLYNHSRNKQFLSLDESFNDFLNACVKYTRSSNYCEENIRYSCLLESKYSTLLSEWILEFGRKNVFVADFDDIENGNQSLYRDLKTFLDVNPCELDFFRHDNASIAVKSKLAHKIALKINAKFEHSLNNAPRVKDFLSKIYFFLNKKQEIDTIDEKSFEVVREYLQDELRSLEKLIDFRPKWLQKYL
jgi:hypothetical protein